MEPKSSVFSKVTPHTHAKHIFPQFPLLRCLEEESKGGVYPAGMGHLGRRTRNTETEGSPLSKSDTVTSVAIFSDECTRVCMCARLQVQWDVVPLM